MATLEITPDQLGTVDTNQIASIELKDGTLIMVNGAEEVQQQGEEEFVQEEQAQEEQAQEELVEECAENVEGQENQLRARPFPGRMVPPVVPVRPVVAPIRPVVPVPVRPVVAPVRPVVPVPVRPLPPKPMVVPRGPMVRPPVFRARPGMPVVRPAVVPPKVVKVPVHKPIMAPVPVHKPAVVPVPVPVRPHPPKPGMLIKPGVARPLPVPVQTVYRARPNVEQQEEEVDYQQEEVAGEEECCQCDGYEQEVQEGDNLRARPMMMAPMVPPPRHHHPHMRPPVVPVPVVPLPPRRGPMMGYNTFQPRVFRARPRPRVVPVPMFTPLNTTFQPRVYGGYGMRGPRYGPMPPMRPHLFRGKERSQSYDEAEAQQCEEQVCEQQCETEQCTKNVCTKCGKEF